MTEELELVAIKKNDKYYVSHKTKYHQYFPDKHNLRFDTNRQESFNDMWIVFNFLPSIAERRIVGRQCVIGYKIKDGFTPTAQTPETLPQSAFVCNDDECDNPEIRGLYDAVFEKRPDTWENVDLDIEVIDEDCEPIEHPKYTYNSDFPHYVDKHTIVRHKYPCHINADDVFKYIVSAVKDVLPDHCHVSSDFDFHFAVDVKIPLLHKENHTIDTSSWNARKPKYQEVPLRHMEKKLIEICTPSHKGGTMIRDVHANNYYELEEKMDDIVQSYVDLLQAKPVVCPNCEGYGWTVEDVK